MGKSRGTNCTESFLHRQRLFDRLDTVEGGKIILLSGPRGSGKTGLLREYVEQKDIQAIWCRFTGRQFESGAFFETVSKTLPRNERETGSLLPSNSDEFIERVNLDLRGRTFLIFDNMELFADHHEISELLSEFAARFDPGIRIVLVSSENIRLTTLRIRRQIAEFSFEDFAFTEGEIADFFLDCYGTETEGETCRLLREQTAGWITALIFMGEELLRMDTALRKGALAALASAFRSEKLDDYFSEHAMSGLPDEVRNHLAVLSIFDEISPEVVQVMLRANGRRFLYEMGRKNLFMMIGDDGWVRFFPVFRGFLRTQFDFLEEAEKAGIHRKAGEFYQSRGLQEKAFYHFVECADLDTAERIFMDLADRLIEEGSYNSVRKYLNSFPVSRTEKSIQLKYYLALTENLVEPMRSRKILESLTESFKASGDYHRAAKIHSVLIMNNIYYQEGKAKIEDTAQKASAFLIEYSTGLRERERKILETWVLLGSWWGRVGDAAASRIFFGIEETAMNLKNEELVLFARLGLARTYLEYDDFNRTIDFLTRTEARLYKSDLNRHYEPLLRFYSADAFMCMGYVDKAIAEVDKGLKMLGGTLFSTYLEAGKIFYTLNAGLIQKAEALFIKFQREAPDETAHYRNYIFYVISMLLAYFNGNRERALHYCTRLESDEKRNLIMEDYPYCHIQLGEVWIFLEGHDKAEKQLRGIMEELKEEQYSYPVATCHALLGYICSVTGRSEEAELCFSEMERIIVSRKISNLEIVKTDLIRDIARISGRECLRSFPRLVRTAEDDRDAPVTCPADTADAKAIHIEAFGKLKIMINGAELDSSLFRRKKKVVDLLCFLITKRKSGVIKEVIAETFWPNYSPKSSRDNLNTIASRLRRLLGSAGFIITSDANCIYLQTEMCEIDSDCFIHHIETAEEFYRKKEFEEALGYFSRAVQLYKNDFLENERNYDEINTERDFLRIQYMKALFKAGKTALELGRYPDAVGYLRTLADKTDLSESAYRMLMIASAFAGNKSDVPKLLKRLESNLEKEYGVRPDRKTYAIAGSLTSGSLPGAPWKTEEFLDFA